MNMKKVWGKAVRRARILAGYFFVNIRRFYCGLNLQKEKDDLASAFLEHGFVNFSPSSSRGFSDYLNPLIRNFIETGEGSNNEFKILSRNEFGIKSLSVDVNSEFLFKYIFTKDVYDLVRKYYGKEFYLRNNPTIEFNYSGESSSAQTFHLDWGLRQISVMFNLNDVTEASTHMIYLTGSQKRYLFSQPDRDSVAEQRRVKEYLEKFPRNVKLTTGKKDAASIFDAGNGYHRQVAGTERIMLHLNFVENLAFSHWDPNWIPAATPGEDYWFSNYSDTSEKLIQQSGIPRDFFSLVFRRAAPAIGIPKIYLNKWQR